MRTLLLTVAALGIAALGHAQTVDPFDYHCSDVALLQPKPIQTELGITEAQRKKMNDAAATHRTRLTTYDAQQKVAKVKDTREQSETKLKGYYDELKKGVFTSLTPGQMKRLRELSLQRAGLVALLDDVVAKRIGFSGAPYESFRKAFTDGAKAAQDLQRTALKPIYDRYAAMKPKTDAEKQSLMQKMQGELGDAAKKVGPQLIQVQNDTQKKLVGLLSPAQKTAWQALLGKPFQPKS